MSGSMHFEEQNSNRIIDPIKTKRGTTLWRGTSIRALIDNPVYIGVLKFGDERSEPFEHLRLIDDATYERCLQTVKARSSKSCGDDLVVPLRTDARGLLTGILYCGECGNRMCYTHNTTKRKLADGTIRVYERDLYRCYRKISSRHTCAGQSTYDMQPINDAVEVQVRSFLSKLASKPREELLQMASARNTEMYKVALKQAEKEYENAQKQVTALEEEAVKALTGESALDLSVINTMIIKHRAKRDAAAQTIEEARARLEQEQMSQKETQVQIDEMLSWADCYDKANIETRHMIIARIIEKVEVQANRKIHIKFRISLDQFLGKSA